MFFQKIKIIWNLFVLKNVQIAKQELHQHGEEEKMITYYVMVNISIIIFILLVLLLYKNI